MPEKKHKICYSAKLKRDSTNFSEAQLRVEPSMIEV